jgi:hypothetical protein
MPNEHIPTPRIAERKTNGPHQTKDAEALLQIQDEIHSIVKKQG